LCRGQNKCFPSIDNSIIHTIIIIAKYKTLHGVDDFLQINLWSNSTSNCIQSIKNIDLAVSTRNNPKITKEKNQDVEYLYKCMPEDEHTYYTNLFHRYKETIKYEIIHTNYSYI